MNWWTYLIIAFTVIFTIMLWNTYNSKSYQRLRKAKTLWDSRNRMDKDKIKRNIDHARQDIRGLWDEIGDFFDEEYDDSTVGYDGEHVGYT